MKSFEYDRGLGAASYGRVDDASITFTEILDSPPTQTVMGDATEFVPQIDLAAARPAQGPSAETE